MQNQENIMSWMTRHQAPVIHTHGPLALMSSGASYDVVCERLTNLNHLTYLMNRDPQKWHPSHIARQAAGIAIFFLSCGYTAHQYYDLTRRSDLQRNADHEAVYTAMSELESHTAPSTMVSELVQSAYWFGISDLIKISREWCNLSGWTAHNRFRGELAAHFEEVLGEIKTIPHLLFFSGVYLVRTPTSRFDVELNSHAVAQLLGSVARIQLRGKTGAPLVTRW